MLVLSILKEYCCSASYSVFGWVVRRWDYIGKIDTATALINFAINNVNNVNIVVSGAVPLLIDLFGSRKGKQNSITLLLGLCKDGDDEVARRLYMNPSSIPSFQSLAADGCMKAQRKADVLLRFLNRCCLQSRNPFE
ncbi:hypothetical protein L2E82_06366 [Cichorium intybus]|uniref:Uncharacterized protein n=1 Tax=Cichorium intybus TaxID=13427 RepID=A0ACB9HAF7_CICIN|nr:hypothetical protein L2E82_06366 [Cichorium intybus]